MVVPALLYALYNNLTFNNLKTFDPNVFQVSVHDSWPAQRPHTPTPCPRQLLMNCRIALTGALSYLVLGRRLTARQCCALLLLLLGCRCSARPRHTCCR